MLAPDQKAWERDFLGGGTWPRLRFIILVGGDLPLRTQGGTSIKTIGKKLTNAGFKPFHFWTPAPTCGSPINEGHSITIGVLSSIPTVRNPPASLGNSLPPRGFNNLLLPVGVPPNAWVRKRMKKRLPSEHRICVLGYVGGKTVHSVCDPLPPLPGQLIKVEKGIRYKLPCEWGHLKGLSKDEAHHLSGAGILKAISANVWSSVILGLENLLPHVEG